MNKIYVGLGALALLVGSFAAGRYTAPETVRIVENRVEIRHEASVIQQKIDISEVVKTVRDEFARANRSFTKTVITRADGTRVEKETENTATESGSKTATDASTKTAATTEAKIWKETVKTETKIVERLTPPKTWGLGIQGGVGLTGNGVSYIPGLPDLFVVGVSVERRLFADVYTGVWLNSRADGGLQLRIGF